MATLALLLAFALPSQDFALLPQDPAPATLALRTTSGETINAQLLDCAGEKVKLKVFVMGGSMTVTNQLDDFEPASVFALELQAKKPKTYEDHFAMAKRAAQLHLLPQAGAQCRAAIKAAEGAADLPQKRTALRAWAADAIEQAIREAIAANNLPMARNALKLLTTRLADQRSEEQIDAVTKTVEALTDQQEAIKAQKQQARLDEKARASIEQRMKPIQKDMQQGDKYLGDAIRKSRSTAASAKLCDQAIDAYKRSYKALQDLVAKYPDDGDLSGSASSLVAHMHDQAIRAGLHAANMLTVQSDFKGAMEWAQRILAFEPENAEAKEMVRTIQMASAEASGDWDWRWMTVGGDRPMPQDDPRTR